MKSALIIVDVQPDFLPGGALAVADGDAILGPLSALIEANAFDYLVATQDWHPPGHESFASQHEGHGVGEVLDLHGLAQVLWPDHCVQETAGAALMPLVAEAVPPGAVFRKGTELQVDSYSGFFDNGRRKSTGLADWLRARDVTTVSVCGLATDYCVKFTALDAQEQGFETTLLKDACRGVNLSPQDVETAIAEMATAGIRISTTVDLLVSLHRPASP